MANQFANLATLPSVVGHMILKGEVAGLNLVPDDFSICTLCKSGRRLCGFPGRNPGEGVKLGEKAMQMKINCPTLPKDVSPFSQIWLQTDRKILHSLFHIRRPRTRAQGEGWISPWKSAWSCGWGCLWKLSYQNGFEQSCAHYQCSSKTPCKGLSCLGSLTSCCVNITTTIWEGIETTFEQVDAQYKREHKDYCHQIMSREGDMPQVKSKAQALRKRYPLESCNSQIQEAARSARAAATARRAQQAVGVPLQRRWGTPEQPYGTLPGEHVTPRPGSGGGPRPSKFHLPPDPPLGEPLPLLSCGSCGVDA
jgi:hypothetical protein